MRYLRTLGLQAVSDNIRLLISRPCFDAVKPEQPNSKTDFACAREERAVDWRVWLKGSACEIFYCVRREWT